MYYSLLLSLFVIVVSSALGMNSSHSILIIAKSNKSILIPRAWLTQEIAHQLQDEHICQWFKNMSPELVRTLVLFCNFVRMESKVNAQSGMIKFVNLNICFEDMPEFLKALVILSLPQNIIIEAARYYVEKASGLKIYLNNYQFHADPVRDKAIKLEIAKWYFLKYNSHLDIPQGTFPSISLHDLLAAEKKVTVTTAGKMVGKLAQIETYCQPDDIVILLNDFGLTSLDGMNDLLVRLELTEDKIAVIDLRGHKLEEGNFGEGDYRACRSAFSTYRGLKIIYLKENLFLRFRQ